MSEKKTYQIYCRGQFVEVSEEIYTYYTRDKWRAEYAEKAENVSIYTLMKTMR